jgi:D-psicose/D-tagatose/L-ribulose 3-epimerase
MKYGVNTFIWTASFTRENLPLLPEIKRHGFDGIEVSMFRPTEFALDDIKRGMQENGLECTICSVIPGGFSVISDDAAVRQKTRTHLEECITMAAEVGAKIIAGPLYSPVGYLPGRRRTKDEWKRAVECYESLGPVINHPNVGILFDTFHANIEEKNIGQAYRTVARHLKHVHTCENDRGIPGSGHVEWQEVFQALRDIRYDGWLTIESFGFSLGELSAAASIWRDIAPTPESIAFEGVKFLKQNVAAAAAR